MTSLHTDPPSAPSRLVLPRSIFSSNPARNRGVAGVGPLKYLPDERLIATLIAHGQPLWAAQEACRYPPARLQALKFWADVQNAARGDKPARERVDYCREAWSRMRRDGQISERPNHAEPIG